jgi:hypothetical protein
MHAGWRCVCARLACLGVSVSCLAGPAAVGHQHTPHQRPAGAATAAAAPSFYVLPVPCCQLWLAGQAWGTSIGRTSDLLMLSLRQVRHFVC